MGNGHQSSHPVVLIEYANAYNLFLSPASTTSPRACSSRLLLQVISLLHSPEALQHASTPACVTSTLHCSIIQQYHCVSSNVLHCTTLHCTALPVCLHTARRRRKEGEKRKKKRCLCLLSIPPPPPASSPTPPLLAAHDPVSPRQPLIPILSNSGSRIKHRTTSGSSLPSHHMQAY